MTVAYQVLPALEYDGTNGQDVCDALALANVGNPADTWTIDTESGGTLVIDYAQHEDGGPGVNHFPLTFETGDVLVGNQVVSAADFATSWRTTS